MNTLKIKKIICLIGPAGSGKSVVSDWFKKNSQYNIFVIGDLCRETAKQKTPLGEKIKSYIDNGDLVPDELIFELIMKNKTFTSSKIIFDGFPRSLNQLDLFLNWQKQYHFDIQFLILECPENIGLKRLIGRRICSKCHRVYHIIFAAPKIINQCDFDQTQLVQRIDDVYQAKKRLKVYQVNTYPMITRLKNEIATKIILINADRTQASLRVELEKIFHKK